MRKKSLGLLLYTICLVFLNNEALAQKTFDFGLTLGRSYYLGEINPTRHYGNGVGSANIGVALRYNLNERYSLKGNFHSMKLKGKDDISDFAFNQNRNARFESSLKELSGSIEFNFLPYRNGDKRYFFTPYLFVGIGVFWYDPKTFIDDTEVVIDETDKQYAHSLIFGPGFRLSLGERFNVGFEWGFRKTTTDEIDGLPNRQADILELGKNYDKDWYVISSFMFMYRITPKGKCAVYSTN